MKYIVYQAPSEQTENNWTEISAHASLEDALAVSAQHRDESVNGDTPFHIAKKILEDGRDLTVGNVLFENSLGGTEISHQIKIKEG